MPDSDANGWVVLGRPQRKVKSITSLLLSHYWMRPICAVYFTIFCDGGQCELMKGVEQVLPHTTVYQWVLRHCRVVLTMTPCLCIVITHPNI